MLRREDFNNDKIDAGEIGAGHTVTALYELTLADSDARQIDPLRYGQDGRSAESGGNLKPVDKSRGAELAFVRLRHKAPGGDTSRLTEQVVTRGDIRELERSGDELRFAASVAASPFSSSSPRATKFPTARKRTCAFSGGAPNGWSTPTPKTKLPILVPCCSRFSTHGRAPCSAPNDRHDDDSSSSPHYIGADDEQHSVATGRRRRRRQQSTAGMHL